ncbi:MAG: dihydroneopterin aldolase [Ramlibacter sp.]|jgi:dihydroneopterin aldolase|nr:dihydroneopterin aldolase [Ramlibacter sp.]
MKTVLAITEPVVVQRFGWQVLHIAGLRFDAMLGVLSHEKLSPQPVSVDAELHLGSQPMFPRDDDIMNVMDYRQVRRIILDECTSGHVNLLETLIGKVAHTLLQLPGVRGVRLKIVKLEIFDDCEVSIRMELGQW